MTGGTGDVKPQILTLTTAIAPAINQYVVRQVALPVPRFGTLKTKATIMEMLRVDWYLGLRDNGDINNAKSAFLSTNQIRGTGEAANNVTIENDAAETTVFAMAYRQGTFVVSGSSDRTYPMSIDLTDNNGNGVLIATDKIFITGADDGGAIPSSYTCKVLYRLVNVGITEYVGIVQSQQA